MSGLGQRARTERTALRALRKACAVLRRRDSLLVNGHLLTSSSLLTAGVGALYWVFAAHLFGSASVGRTYSAISALMFLAGAGQLNLANTVVRFVPRAGPRTRRLALWAYAAAAAASAALGAAFVVLIPEVTPDLVFLRTPALGAAFVVATVGYAIFVLQDGVLTGLRRAHWVVVENAVFAVAKFACLAALAAAGATAAILGSWAAGLVVSLALTNIYLFGRAIPRVLSRPTRPRDPDSTPTAGYLAADFVGSLCWLAVVYLPPIMVLNTLGPDDSAYFSIAWLITYALYMVAINMCASLVVEGSDDPARLRDHTLRLLGHVGRLLGAGVSVVVVAAPWLLAAFGGDYARGGAPALRLLALSALPNLVVTCAVAVCRVRRRMHVAVGVLSTLAVMVLGLTAALLPVLGTVGGGLAWLVAQCVAAGVLLWRHDWWLPPGTGGLKLLPDTPRGGAQVCEPPPKAVPVPASAELSAAERLRGLRPIRRSWPLHVTVDRVTTRRIARQLRPDDLPRLRCGPPGLADVLVLRQDGTPPLAVKHARTARAAAELAHEWEVLCQLRADERLGQWRALVPAAVACHLDEPLPLITEVWLPGEDCAARLQCRPWAAHEVTMTALDALAQLHRASRRAEPADAHIGAWVDAPADALAAEVPWCRGGANADALACLREGLHRALRGRTVEVAWTHGDYHPGNVLMEDNRSRVTGIIDWGGARENGLAALDACAFVLMLRCLVEQRELGSVVCDVLRTGTLEPYDAHTLARGYLDHLAEGSGSAGLAPGPDLVLLAWLRHVAVNMAKSPRYARSRIWVARNVTPVLEEAARWVGR